MFTCYKLLFLFVLLLLNIDKQYCFPHVQNYVENALRESRIDFNNEADFNHKTTSSLKIITSFEEVFKSGYIIALFNETYLAIGQELILLSNNGLNKTILNTKQNLTFIKTFEDQNKAFLSIWFDNNICDLYTLSKGNDVAYIQTIIFKNPAHYFQYFKLNNLLHFSMDNSIYSWSGTYFDQTSQLPHDGLIICNFPSDMGSQIIISEQIENNKKMVFVYEIIDNEFIKLQTLNNLNNIQTAISYVHENISHVMFIKDHGTTMVYRWIDFELVFLANLNQFDQSKMSFAYVNQSIPVFIVAKMNTISLYRLSKTESCLYTIAVISASKILDISITSDLNILILTNSVDGRTIFSSLQFDNKIIQEDNVVIETNELFECMVKLEKELKGSLNLQKTDPSLINSLFQTRSLREHIELDNHNTKIFNGKVIIKSNLLAEHLKIDKPLFFNILNRIAWTPKNWLSKSKSQRIPGTVIAKKLNVQTLISKNTPLFTGLLFVNPDQSIQDPVLIQKDLVASSLETSKINGIKFEDIYLKNSGKKILGTKQFKNVNTNDSTIDKFNRFEAATILALFSDQKAAQYNFSKNLHIESLELNKINEIDFDDLYSSVYKVGVDNAIQGNLNIQTAFINDLVSKNISGINSNLFLDKVSPQTVNSSIEFRNIDANKITAKNINGDDVINFVHVSNNDTAIIKGKVRINDIRILGEFHLNEFMSDMIESERILGTNATDLLQIYNKPVKIIGNVVVNNLILQNNIVPTIDSLPFSYDDLDHYWRYDKTQTVNKHVTFKSGMAVPSLNLGTLNNIPFNNYVLRDENILSNINLNFETLILNGNLVSNQSVGCEKFLNESVKVTGEYFLTGKKMFAGNVGVNKLKTRRINGIDVKDLPHQNNLLNTANTFSTIVFKENVQSEVLVTKSINNKELEQMWNSALRTNMDLKAEQFIFDNLTVLNLRVGDLNGVHFNEYISSLDRIYQLKSIENVLVSNAIGRDFEGVKTINSVPFLEIVNHENYDLPLTGDYHFNSNLFIKNLKVTVVNGINFGNLTQELLYRYWSQDIVGYHSFNVVQAAHLGTPRINSYNLENLIDVTSEDPQELHTPGLFLSEAQFAKSLFSARMKYDINKLTNILRNEPARFWTSVTILNNVELLDEDCTVQQLVNRAVRRGHNQETVITGQVTFEYIQVKNVQTDFVNGINLDGIFKDAVLKNEADQIIMGKKQFIKLSAQAAASLADVQIPIVNKIVLSVVNSSIVNKNSINSIVIRGQKTFFDGLQTDHIISNNISNFPIGNIVSSEQLRRNIASVKFDKLEIARDLRVNSINNVNFDEFLNDRLLLEGPLQVVSTVAYIDFLNINAPAVTLPSINKILMTDVVFDEETLIESIKVFKNAIHSSKTYVEFVNGRDVSQMYQNSIFYDDALINVSSIQFGANAILSGESVAAITLNNVNMDAISDMVDVSVILKRSEIIQNNINNIRKSLTTAVQSKENKATQYAYIDPATELQVNLPNAVDGRISVSHALRGDLLLHVDAEESARFCQLPPSCPCYIQHTVHISSAYSVGLLENKGTQRVFTYFAQDTAVNIVTNSVSTSDICRKENLTDELTTITWTIAKTRENQHQTSFVYPETITGYISQVAFFEFNDILYFVISRKYDAQKDTNDVDAIVLRFSQNKDQINVIQYIPSRKSSNANVFHTSSGIILVIDSTPKITVGTDIDGVVNVYKFNEQLQTFELLRSIMDGACSNSQQLKIDEESHFIVLTCRDSVKLFKYYPEFMNYYLFQVIMEPNLISATVVQPDVYERAAPILFISRRDSFAVFRFRYLSGFSLFYEKSMQGMHTFVPFILNSKQFLFCPRQHISVVLKVITNG